MVLHPEWEPLLVLGIALALGFLIGIEREWAQKGVGVRTFPLIAMSTALAAHLSVTAGFIALGVVGLVVAAISLSGASRAEGFGTTTNVAMIFTGVLGLMVGMQFYVLAVAAAVVATWSLAWKQELHGFATGLSQEELRSGIQLALLAFVVFPFLPDQTVDPWGLINPRTVWWVVIIMGVLSSVNYMLLKRYGGKGLLYSSFFGALVNSLAAVTAAIKKIQEQAGLKPYVTSCVSLAVMGMVIKNLAIFWLLYPAGGPALAVPMGILLAATVVVTAYELMSLGRGAFSPPETLELPSPFNLRTALGFGVFFLTFTVLGGLAELTFGTEAFYLTIAVASIVSSGTASAASAVLAAQGDIALATGVTAVVLAAFISLVVKVITAAVLYRDGEQTRRSAVVLALPAVTALGAILVLML